MGGGLYVVQGLENQRDTHEKREGTINKRDEREKQGRTRKQRTESVKKEKKMMEMKMKDGHTCAKFLLHMHSYTFIHSFIHSFEVQSVDSHHLDIHTARVPLPQVHSTNSRKNMNILT